MNNTGTYGIIGGFLVGLIVGGILAFLYNTHPGYFAVAQTRDEVLKELLVSPVTVENIEQRMSYLNDTSERQFANELKSMGGNPEDLSPQFWDELRKTKKSDFDSMTAASGQSALDVFEGLTVDELQRVRNFNLSSAAIKIAKNRSASRSKANDENMVFIKQIREYALDLYTAKFPAAAAKLKPAKGYGPKQRPSAASTAPVATPTQPSEAATH